MTDYIKYTGSTGKIMIRDTGTYVEFWVTANNNVTYNYSLPWAYTINGSSSGWKYYKYVAGAGWEKLGSWNITYSQTVTFKLGDTGTVGLGGPTTFSVSISRAKVPSAPSAVTLSSITHNSVYGTFTDGASNGATIDSRQIGYGTSSSTVQSYITSDGSTSITGLSPGKTYYFWARTHNSVGWSSWGPRSQATLIAIVNINVAGTWRQAIPYVNVAGVWHVARPWSRVAGVWKETT